jgi:hypothetical protein
MSQGDIARQSAEPTHGAEPTVNLPEMVVTQTTRHM